MIEFRIGNLVKHKLGGPIMVINGTSKGAPGKFALYTCTWVEDGQKKQEILSGQLLQHVYADGSPRDYQVD